MQVRDVRCASGQIERHWPTKPQCQGHPWGWGGEEQSLQQGAVTQSNNLSPRGDVAPRGGMALMGDGRRLCQLVHQAACPAHV